MNTGLLGERSMFDPYIHRVLIPFLFFEPIRDTSNTGGRRKYFPSKHNNAVLCKVFFPNPTIGVEGNGLPPPIFKVTRLAECQVVPLAPRSGHW